MKWGSWLGVLVGVALGFPSAKTHGGVWVSVMEGGSLVLAYGIVDILKCAAPVLRKKKPPPRVGWLLLPFFIHAHGFLHL